MAYLTLTDLTTHIYPEIIKEIVRDYTTAYANLAGFPVSGVSGRKYFATDTSKTYIWIDNAYGEITPFDLVQNAIDAAIAEAKSYLNKYNLTLLFADDFPDPNLKNKVKDLACWHLIKLSNPNIEVAMFRTAYEDAIKYFDKVTKGFVDPEGWPYKTNDPDTKFPEGSSVTSSSSRKRHQHW